MWIGNLGQENRLVPLSTIYIERFRR